MRYDEPPHLDAINELEDVETAITNAIVDDPSVTAEAILALANDLREAAIRHGIYKPLE